MSQTTRTRQELTRRYLLFGVSLFFIALGVSLITRSYAGTSPISSIPYVLSLHSILTMGTFILLLNLLLMAGQMMMLGPAGIRQCKWELIMQLPVSVLFGLFVDLTMAMLSFWHPDIYWLKLLSLAAGCLSMALGVALEVTADVAMVSGEYFVHIASRRFRKEFGTVKILFDISLVIIAVACSWILAGHIDGVREGTLIAAILTGPLVRLIMPRLHFLRRWIDPGSDTPADTDTAAMPATDTPRIITIAREYGSGGHDIGRQLADHLGIPFYDNAMMEMVARESGIALNTVRKLDQRLPHNLLLELITQDFPSTTDRPLSTKDALFVAQSRVIRRLASQGPCVIVGRCSDYVLRDIPGVINIFLHASPHYKAQRAITTYGIDPQRASAHVRLVNAKRAAHYAYYTGKRWDDLRNYHATFSTSETPPDTIVAAISRLYHP